MTRGKMPRACAHEFSLRSAESCRILSISGDGEFAAGSCSARRLGKETERRCLARARGFPPSRE